MKAEHRKELHTNALAAQLTRLVEGVKSRPNTRSVIIWGLILLAIGLFFGWRYLSRHWESKRSAEWRKLEMAASLAELDQIAQEARGLMPGQIAEVQRARVLLLEGLQHLGSSARHASAVKQIQEAGAIYERLAEQTKNVPLLAQEAMLNAGKAKESLGDLDGALAWYGKLAQAYPKSALGKQAAERQKKLEDQRARLREFYDELEKLASQKE